MKQPVKPIPIQVTEASNWLAGSLANHPQHCCPILRVGFVYETLFHTFVCNTDDLIIERYSSGGVVLQRLKGVRQFLPDPSLKGCINPRLLLVPRESFCRVPLSGTRNIQD